MRALGWARALTLVVIGAGAMTGIVTATAGASLVAPTSTCDGQNNVHAPNRVQETAMRCLINYAREHSGMHGVGSSTFARARREPQVGRRDELRVQPHGVRTPG